MKYHRPTAVAVGALYTLLSGGAIAQPDNVRLNEQGAAMIATLGSKSDLRGGTLYRLQTDGGHRVFFADFGNNGIGPEDISGVVVGSDIVASQGFSGNYRCVPLSEAEAVDTSSLNVSAASEILRNANDCTPKQVEEYRRVVDYVVSAVRGMLSGIRK